MNNIDMSMLITAQMRAQSAELAELEQLKLVCRNRIFAVADQLAQTNLAAAAGAGKLDEEERAAYGAFLGWIEDMRAVCQMDTAPARLAQNDTTLWPVLPEAAAALAGQF